MVDSLPSDIEADKELDKCCPTGINPARQTNKWDSDSPPLHSRPHHLQLDQAIRKSRLNGVKGIEQIVTSTLQEALSIAVHYMIKSYTLAAPEEAPPSRALGTLTHSAPYLPDTFQSKELLDQSWTSEEPVCQSPAIKMPTAQLTTSRSPATGGGDEVMARGKNRRKKQDRQDTEGTFTRKSGLSGNLEHSWKHPRHRFALSFHRMLDPVNSTIRVTIQGTGSELEVSKRRLEDPDEMSRTWTNPLTQATGGPPQPVRGSLGVSVPPTERDAPHRSHVSMGPPSPSLRDAEARSSTPWRPARPAWVVLCDANRPAR
ncbi:hypothetical protein B0T09DRAFT_397414 [Sordaria sp. MPI-SDFR-AT-0083]|nr:hypothetical protein B0T09DRAFT_397414 [Sordaria sp. MPI-SDFR-AT-0083]